MSFSSKGHFKNNGCGVLSVLYQRGIYYLRGGKDSEKTYFYKSQELLNYAQPRLFTNRVTSFHKLQYVAAKITKYFLLVYIKCVEILNRLSTHKRPIESKIAKLVQRGSLNFTDRIYRQLLSITFVLKKQLLRKHFWEMGNCCG